MTAIRRFDAKISRRSFVAGTAAVLGVGARPTHSATIKLRVSATPSIFKAMFERLTHQFQLRNPGIAVELTVFARGQDDQNQTTLRQALIGDLPDVSFEGLSYLPVLQKRRIAVPLNDLIKADPEWNDAVYSRSVIESASVDHSIIGLGTAVSVPLIYFNADLVAGVLGSQPLPQQWDQILALIKTLARSSKPGAISGFCQHPPGNWIYLALVESLGGSLMSPDDRQITFDAAPGKRALEIYEAFGRAGQASVDMANDQARQAFVGGGISLLVDSSSSLAMFENQIGGRFKLGTARFPIAANGHIPPSGIASVLIARDPIRQAAAWKFMKFASGPEGQVIIGESTGYFPANELVIQRAEWLGNYYRARPLMRPILDSLPFTSRWRAFPGDNSARIDSVVFNGVASVVTLTKTPEQALTEMKRAAQALLPRLTG